MPKIDLGFVAEEEYNKSIINETFPCKIGGKPVWLETSHFPSCETLQCAACTEPCSFLLQIYCPIDDQIQCFHRTLYIFACRNYKCTNRELIALRCQLPEVNYVYAFDQRTKRYARIPRENKLNLNLCSVCGCFGPKTCSSCKIINYCSKKHQVMDWKQNHKFKCNSNEENQTTNVCTDVVWEEHGIVIDAEDSSDISDGDSDDDEQVEDEKLSEAKTFEKILKDYKVNEEIGRLPADEVEKYFNEDTDKAYRLFMKRIERDPGQILRYDRLGQPLNISDINCESIPNCEYCGSKRVFEFQVMPGLLSFLHEHTVDFGTLHVYTCERSCSNFYAKEFVFNQTLK